MKTMTYKKKVYLITFFAYLLFLSSPLLAELSSPLLSISSNAENLTLNWTEVNNATSYQLYYVVYPYKSGDLIQSVDMGSTLSFNAKLWDGASYYVAIQAYSNSESSTFSNIEYFVLDTKHISYTSEAGSFNGLTLIAPMASKTTYLIDDKGNNKHQWESSFTPALSAYLLKNGNLLRTGSDKNGSFSAGGQGGYIEEMDWEGNVLWQFKYSDSDKVLHHDIKRMANGNTLALAWELKEDIWTEVIIEIEKQGATGGKIVWKWDIWDHLNELGLDSNSARTDDWIHLNSIDYNEASNQIMVSSRSHSQVWIINKSDSSIATISSVAMTAQHDAKWIDINDAMSNITIFDNGQSFSRSLEVDKDLKNIIWSYGNATTEKFFANHISGTQRLSNGNTIVCNGVDAVIIELDNSGNKTREYTSIYTKTTPRGEIKEIFRAEKYATAYTPYF
ncbi:MAG: aryl-sulfate sulfotransferase [gamma proteobacterium symbiont of Taylorina sp.]|nr:aryl-sulfate sulfotransferase [gamma proteobacterium symbiont of Taylorina sp.]